MRETSVRNELWRGGNVGFRECDEQRHVLGTPLEERRTVHLVRTYTGPPKRYGENGSKKGRFRPGHEDLGNQKRRGPFIQ